MMRDGGSGASDRWAPPTALRRSMLPTLTGARRVVVGGLMNGRNVSPGRQQGSPFPVVNAVLSANTGIGGSGSRGRGIGESGHRQMSA